MKKPRKPAPKPAGRQPRAQAQPAAKPKPVAKAKAAPVKKRKPRPAQPVKPKHPVHMIKVPRALGPVWAVTAFSGRQVSSLGSWSRRRAGMLLIFALVILALYSQWLVHAVAQPRLMAACGDHAFVREIVMDRGCTSVEHCTERERAREFDVQLAFELAGFHCRNPEPWSPHKALYQAGVWAIDTIAGEPEAEEPSGEPDESTEAVVIASNA